MDLYSWLIIFLWIRTTLSITTALSSDTIDNVGIETTTPEFRNMVKRSSGLPLLNCLYPARQSPPVELFLGLSSRFCHYIENKGPIERNTTLERSYLINGDWHTFSVKWWAPCKGPGIYVSNHTCIQDLDTLWRGCKGSQSYASSI